ncbi:MAG TPA: diguanylate cyclase [Anaerolineales bacterium]|nr:diguanylate cyclase [Anaerolineales bacterium]
MTNLKRSFFWAGIYLAVIFVLAQTDYISSPIIDFASYFYLSVMITMPVTLFFPSISRVSTYVPLLVWAGFYLVLLQTIDRSASAIEGQFSVIVLEFILLEVGVWFSHQLAVQISHAESIMDALALSAFPNRAHDIEVEDKRIKVELTRSRRYHRPLSVVLIESESDDDKVTREMLKSIQHDLLSRFTLARVGQIIDDRIRQTDLVLRDHTGRFIILCPETDLDSARLLSKRIAQSVKERTELEIRCGVAAFPDEALTFDDLLHKARQRIAESALVKSEAKNLSESQEPA